MDFEKPENAWLIYALVLFNEAMKNPNYFDQIDKGQEYHGPCNRVEGKEKVTTIYAKGYENGSEETYMDVQKLMHFSSEELIKYFGSDDIQYILLKNGLKDIQEVIGRVMVSGKGEQNNGNDQ